MASGRIKVALVANTGWYLYNFRRTLMKVLKAKGHDVIAISPRDDYTRRLVDEGISHHHIPLDGGSINPAKELRSILALRRVLCNGGVDVVFSFTPKGNIYSGLALMGRKTQLVANVSGLGRAFVSRSFLTLLVRRLFYHTFGRAAWVFFQNEDDRQIFINAGMVEAKKSERIPGSGVDLGHFSPSNDACTCEEAPTFLLIARLLWDKGVGEFVDAARYIRKQHPKVRFQLLGFLDVSNPSAVPRRTVEGWVEKGIIEYLGTTDDVRPHVCAADCVVLPSFYREGVPRSLLEAAAMGKPIITTDSVGCRDAVDDGITGFLCLPRDVGDLSEKILLILKMSPEERNTMGLHGRGKMMREFDEKIIIERYLAIIDKPSPLEKIDVLA